MNRKTSFAVLQTLARNRRDALAKVTFRDRLMPLNGFFAENKDGHIQSITELPLSVKIVLLIFLLLPLSNENFLVDSLNLIRLKRKSAKQDYS